MGTFRQWLRNRSFRWQLIVGVGIIQVSLMSLFGFGLVEWQRNYLHERAEVRASRQAEVVALRDPQAALAKLQGWLSEDHSQDQSHLARMAGVSLFFTLSAIALGAMLTYALTLELMKPLRLLIDATERLARDELERPVPVKSENELGVLTRAFNTAMGRLLSQRRELETAKQSAENANVAKTNFLANMSHEIRTPLGAILGFSNLLQEEKLPEKDRGHYLEIINRNGEELTRLVDDILDVSKVEAGRMTVERKDISLVQFLDETLAPLKEKAEKKGLTFWLVVEPTVPISLYTDPMRLKQVLLNVVGNAVKFTEGGGITITVKRQAPEGMKPEQLMLMIEDTGTGIAENRKQGLFQPFMQADSSMTRKFGGAGMGLFLSRRLARALGGDVVLAESIVGHGSTFLITVANEHAAKDARFNPMAVISKPLISASTTDQTLRGVRVLAVEDSPDNQLLIKKLLTKRGADVELANNGQEGAEMALNDDYDLVLMDIQMPVLDGYQAVKRLREKGYNRPVVALTAHAMAEDRQRCMAAGFNEYLSKPISPSSLMETVVRFSRLS